MDPSLDLTRLGTCTEQCARLIHKGQIASFVCSECRVMTGLERTCKMSEQQQGKDSVWKESVGQAQRLTCHRQKDRDL